MPKIDPNHKIFKCHNGCLTIRKIDPDQKPLCDICPSCGEHDIIEVEKKIKAKKTQ